MNVSVNEVIFNVNVFGLSSKLPLNDHKILQPSYLKTQGHSLDYITKYPSLVVDKVNVCWRVIFQLTKNLSIMNM